MAPDGNAAYPFIDHYDGEQWTTQSAVTPALTVLYGLAAASPTDIWAVGRYENGDADYEHTLLMHFDGQVWATVPTPYVDKANGVYSGVAIMSNKPQLWTVGIANDAIDKKPATYSRSLIESLTLTCP